MEDDRVDFDSRPRKRQRRESMSPSSARRSNHKSAWRGDEEDSHLRQMHEHEERGKDRHGRTDRKESHRDSRSPHSSDGIDVRDKSHRRRSRERSKREDDQKRRRDHSRSRSPERRRRSRYSDHSERDDRHRKRERERDHDRDRNRTRHRSQSAQPYERSKRPLPSQQDAFTSTSNPERALDKPLPDKQKPNFGLTGKLAAASNTVHTGGQTIVLKYHEPPEARKPAARDAWRLYVFKGKEIVETVELAEQSCWLFGREVAVVDFPVEHPSCSKQHAVIQFRYIEKKNEFGDRIGKVKPYVIDLESANGTNVNDGTIPAAKYVELRDKDVVKFGHSSREYMIQLPPRS